MSNYVRFRIEVNVAKIGADPRWHYLMDDDYSACEFDDEGEARAVMISENRGINIRLIGFTVSGIGRAVH